MRTIPIRTILFAMVIALVATGVSKIANSSALANVAQVPDEESDELAELLEEQNELSEWLQEVRQEADHIKNSLNRVQKLVQLQRKLDALNHRIDVVEDDDLLEQLEFQAEQTEFRLEQRREIHEMEGFRIEIIEFANDVNELDLDFDTARVADQLIRMATTVAELQKARETLLNNPNLDPPEAVWEKIDRLEVDFAEGEKLFELVDQLLIAVEEEDDDTVERLVAKLSVRSSNSDGKTSREFGEKPALNPAHLPIAIDATSLKEFRNVDFAGRVVPLLKDVCFDCHSNDSSLGDLNIELMIAERPLVANRQKWVNIIEQLRNRAMPPEDGAPLDNEDRKLLVMSLHNAIHNFDYNKVKHPGYEPIRRLTLQEYDNTLSDLFGVKIAIANRFPKELAGTSGFDNSSNTLFIQPLLMERFISAADEVVETLFPEHPTTDRQRKAHSKLFFKQPTSAANEPTVAADVLNRFVSRAYRRPVTNEERRLLADQYDKYRLKKIGHEQAIKRIVYKTLISPDFLLKSESYPNSDKQYSINDWELASRLSYFLWASMPDAELFKLAAKGRLHQPDVLRKQVDRMLDDPRAMTLGQRFAAQWLGSQHLGTRVRLDPIDNPWCTDSLMKAMRDETAMFVYELIRKDSPIEMLINADFTYLNGELARHYGIRGVVGEKMQRVKLTDGRRGGILGHGSILAVTSFPYRTSPVVRGKWILETVLGTPPPAPPPNVSELSEEIEENERLTIREKLELHRNSPNCYACHSQMDPLGLALERYDWFGRYRRRAEGRRIDDTGMLPDGKQFQGLAGLKDAILKNRKDDLLRQVSTRMFSYALGRQLEYYDETAIRELLADVKSENNRFRPLIHGIVQSYPFRYKKIEADPDELTQVSR